VKSEIKLNIDAITLDEDGCVELNDEMLQSLEKDAVLVTAGGGDAGNGCTNYLMCDGCNAVCDFCNILCSECNAVCEGCMNDFICDCNTAWCS